MACRMKLKKNTDCVLYVCQTSHLCPGANYTKMIVLSKRQGTTDKNDFM